MPKLLSICELKRRDRRAPALSIAALFLVLILAGCATPPLAKVFRSEKLAEMDAAIISAIASNQIPGGVLWVEHNGVAYHKAFG